MFFYVMDMPHILLVLLYVLQFHNLYVLQNHIVDILYPILS